MRRTIDDIIRKHPDRVPVRVLVSNDIELKRSKYLVPKEMTAGQFTSHVRNSMNLKSSESVFMFVGKSLLPPVSKQFGDLYRENAAPDGMLYVTYNKENTFG